MSMVGKDNDFIYNSMLQKIFTEYVDNIVSYVDEDKHKRLIELGRVKSHGQKKRAKEGLKMLPKEQQEVFVLGCYEELKIQLLRQLYRMLGDSDDYKRAAEFLTEIINKGKKDFKKWLKGSK